MRAPLAVSERDLCMIRPELYEVVRAHGNASIHPHGAPWRNRSFWRNLEGRVADNPIETMHALRSVLVFTFAAVPVVAHANDLAEALNFAADVMGDDIVVGYEEFMDWDETEALGILLARDVRPGAPPDSYFEPDVTEAPQRKPHFATLGPSRSNYSALAPFIEEASRATGLPAALIDAVIRTESGYRPNAVSSAGARGLMQLMPATAAEVGVRDPFDPRQNIMGGARYLRKMFDRFGSLKLAVAAYNAGPAAVARHRGIPPFAETRRYVKVVLTRYEKSPIRVR